MLAAERRAADLRVRRQRTEADRVAVERRCRAARRAATGRGSAPAARRARRSARPSGPCRRRSAGPAPSASDGVRLGEVARARDGRLDRHRLSRPTGARRAQPASSRTSDATIPNPTASWLGENAAASSVVGRDVVRSPSASDGSPAASRPALGRVRAACRWSGPRCGRRPGSSGDPPWRPPAAASAIASTILV